LFAHWRDQCHPLSPIRSFLPSHSSQVNYQYRHGTSFPVALRTIYADGGIPRFYRGVIPALAQGPLSRFGDTAANTGMLTLLDSFETTKDLNVGYKTVAASIAAGLFRIVLMPVVRSVHVGFVRSFSFVRSSVPRFPPSSNPVIHFSHGIILR
jgi:hypothetical protein